jgi:hypothetical protein
MVVSGSRTQARKAGWSFSSEHGGVQHDKTLVKNGEKSWKNGDHHGRTMAFI